MCASHFHPRESSGPSEKGTQSTVTANGESRELRSDTRVLFFAFSQEFGNVVMKHAWSDRWRESTKSPAASASSRVSNQRRAGEELTATTPVWELQEPPALCHDHTSCHSSPSSVSRQNTWKLSLYLREKSPAFEMHSKIWGSKYPRRRGWDPCVERKVENAKSSLSKRVFTHEQTGLTGYYSSQIGPSELERGVL